MNSLRTGLGQVFAIEPHLPNIGWKPRFRSVDGSVDSVGDDIGTFAIIGVILLVILLIIFVVPLLLFVAEVALVVALIIPLTILALVVGLKQHSVVLRDKHHGLVIDQRSVHGVIGSLRAARELKSAALAGVAGGRKMQRAALSNRGRTSRPRTSGPESTAA